MSAGLLRLSAAANFTLKTTNVRCTWKITEMATLSTARDPLMLGSLLLDVSLSSHSAVPLSQTSTVLRISFAAGFLHVVAGGIPSQVRTLNTRTYPI